MIKTKIKTKDVFKDIKTYPSHFFNTIFTDPPYNLGSKWYIAKNGSFQVKNKTDFMNQWQGLDGKQLNKLFKEFFRILKYGGFCIVFGMDRQLAPFQYYAVKNGFEICQSLYWYYISSLPKSTDVFKQISKRIKTEKEKIIAKQFLGYKYGISPLKQVLETIMVFRKPYKYNSKSVLKDIINIDDKTSPSILNIDGERINLASIKKNFLENIKEDFIESVIKNQSEGKFPSQLFISEEAMDIMRKQGNCCHILHTCNYEQEEIDLLCYCPKVLRKERNLGLDDTFEDKPAGSRMRNDNFTRNYMGNTPACKRLPEKNNHPTIKPIQLCTHIANLFRLPKQYNQKFYVPFSGVGSEIIGIIRAGIPEDNIYACEINPEYVKIAEARIKYWKNKAIEKLL